MKSIPIKNKELLHILNTFLEAFKKEDKTKIANSSLARNKDSAQSGPVFATSNQYLEEMQGKRHVSGYPEITYGADFMVDLPELERQRLISQELSDAVKVMDGDLLAWSGSRFNAVKMYYPKGGFMGWHHNANCPGYNVLLSWSKDGLGFFRYQDPITKEVVTMQDTPGWTCKVGYYGSWEEKDKIYWHCASAEHEERLTLGYVIPHEGMWKDMCEDIANA